MADIGVLPKLTGQGWSVKKTPTWQTRIQRAASGRELRALDYPFPLWQFEATWPALGDNLGAPAINTASIGSLLATDLRNLMGFYLACQGAFATFLYDDPTDDSVLGQAIATGDGATTTFQLVRTFGAPIGFVEPIVAPNVVAAVYLNGIGSSGVNWSVAPATGFLTFVTAPGAGVAITADFSYYFRCRFMSDAYQFENFMFRLWSLKKLDFISVRP